LLCEFALKKGDHSLKVADLIMGRINQFVYLVDRLHNVSMAMVVVFHGVMIWYVIEVYYAML